MTNLAVRNFAACRDTCNVSAILGLLQSIHHELSGDVITIDVAINLGRTIVQLRDLQQLAHQTMIEMDRERSLNGRGAEKRGGKPKLGQ